MILVTTKATTEKGLMSYKLFVPNGIRTRVLALKGRLQA